MVTVHERIYRGKKLTVEHLFGRSDVVIQATMLIAKSKFETTIKSNENENIRGIYVDYVL